MERKFKHSKLFIQRTVDGHTFFEAVFHDLEDADLQMHFNAAINAEDYEYAEECAAEASKRNLKLTLEEHAK